MIYIGLTLFGTALIIAGLGIWLVKSLIQEQNEDQDGDESESI
jgi:hypothetical protein